MARAADDVEGPAPGEAADSAETAPDAETVEVELTEVAETVEAPTVTTPRRRFRWRRASTAPEAPDESGTEVVETSEAETVAAEPESGVPLVGESAAGESEADESDPGESDADETVAGTPDTDDTVVEEPVLVPHRTAPRGLKIATAVAAALVVLAAAFAGAMLQPYLVERANVQIKQKVAETAANAITTLWSYTPEDIDTLGDRTAGYLGGDFAAQYRDFIDSIVEANKQAQVTNQTQVVGAAVESLTPTEATAIVYTNSVSTTPNSQGFQSMRYVSYRLTLENRDRKWLVTRMSGITSLDLAPRL